MKVGPENGAYEITIPGTWKFVEGGGSFDIYKDADAGAMSISDYIIPPEYNFVREHELMDFLKSINDPPIFKQDDIRYPAENWCSAEVIKEDKYFKVWLYHKYSTAIFITWVCDVSDKDVDIAEVEKMVSSLTPRGLDLFQ